jgi:hypothetical protein
MVAAITAVVAATAVTAPAEARGFRGSGGRLRIRAGIWLRLWPGLLRRAGVLRRLAPWLSALLVIERADGSEQDAPGHRGDVIAERIGKGGWQTDWNDSTRSTLPHYRKWGEGHDDRPDTER